MRYLFDITLAFVVLALFTFVIFGSGAEMLSQKLGGSVSQIELVASLCLALVVIVRLSSLLARHKKA